MITTHHSHNPIKVRSNLSQVLQISAWGFIIVASSFLFLYAGRWIDTTFNTEPSFMIGLFILAIFLCIWRLYGEARLNMERQRKDTLSPMHRTRRVAKNKPRSTDGI